MTFNEMKSHIKHVLSAHEGRGLTHNELWRACGSPHGEDSHLFDKALLELVRENEILNGPPRDASKTYRARFITQGLTNAF